MKLKKQICIFIAGVVALILGGCAKRQAPTLTEIPTYNFTSNVTNQTALSPIFKNETTEKKTVFPNATVSALNIPVENSTKVFEESASANATNATKKSTMNKWEYWKKYGRSTPPLLAIFFDFNKYDIRPDMWSRIKHNVLYLTLHPKVKVELQGNCDERGTSEYNLALGAKRALEVKKVLEALGISKDRIFTISFGEERPLAKCHNETCWAINRRVDFVIIK